MKKTKKFMTTALALMLSVACVTTVGCGGREKYEEAVDQSKTQIIVSNYDGGVGTDWLRDLKAKYEALYADKSYEEGKRGVQVLIDANKIEKDNFTWAQTSAQVAFTEKMTNQYILNMAGLGQLENVEGIFDKILAQDGVSLSEEIIGASKVMDGHSVYAIPHYEGGGGIVYDKDLFDSLRFYRDKDGGFTDKNGDLSVGPDGKAGTTDDGLPTTIEEFFELCTRMKQNDVTPFIVSGEWKTSYSGFILDRLSAAYSGREQLQARYTFNGGQVDYVASFSASESAYFGYDITTEKRTINEESGYNSFQMPGDYYALEFMKKIFADSLYDIQGWSSTVSHLDAQDLYLRSTNKTPIAMLIDGTWWENEATPVFESMAKKNPAMSKSARKFGWMPMPTRVDENDNNESKDTMMTYDSLVAVCLVKSGLSDGIKKAIEDFLLLCYSAENLEAFTAKTGVTRPFTYNVSQKTLDGMTEFQKEVWEMHTDKQFFYPKNANQFYTKNEPALYRDRLNSSVYTTPFSSFVYSNVAPKEFFLSLKKTPEDWAKLNK